MALQRWLQAARQRTEEGQELLLLEVERLFGRLALVRTGGVSGRLGAEKAPFRGRKGVASRTEWLHYWMLEASAPSSYALSFLQEELRRLLKDSTEAKSRFEPDTMPVSRFPHGTNLQKWPF